MIYKSLTTKLIIRACALMLTLGAVVGAKEAAAQVQLDFQPAVLNLSAGERALVEIVVRNVPAPGLAAFQFALDFNPDTIDILNPNEAFRNSGITPFAPLGGNAFCAVVRGTATCEDPNWFLTSTERAPTGTDEINNDDGLVQVAYGTRGDQSAVTGTGTIAIIEVVGTAGGMVVVNLGDVLLADDQEPPGLFPFDMGTLTVQVADSLIAPELGAIGNQTVDEGTELSFTASATDANAGDALAFSLDTGAPAGAAIDSASGKFTWTPTEAEGPGDVTITVRVTDNGTTALDDSETLSITVNEVNVAPVLAAIADQSVDEGASLNVALSASDADLPANTLSLAAEGLPAFCSLSDNGDGTGGIECTPGFGDAGSSAVTVTVSDDGVPAMNDTKTFTLSVGDVNRPPVLAPIGNQSVGEETPLSFTASASDPDAGDMLSFTLDAAAIALGMSIDATTGAFSWTPSEAQGPGVYDVTVTVTDDGTPVLDDTETLSITVNEVNVAPVLAAIADQSVDEGASLNVALSASDADLPANTLSLAAQGLPAFCSLSDGGDGTGGIECTPGFGDAGSSAVTVTVSDDGVPAMNDTKTFTLSVGDVNRPPVLDAIGNQSVDEETQLSFTASASDPDTGDTLSFTLDAAAIALGMSIDATTGAFSWTPSEAQGPGDYDVTVTVTDDGTPVLDDTETLSITVNEVNVAPVLAAIADQSVDEGASLNVALSASDADLPANTLSLAAQGLPAFCSLSDNGDGTGGIECTPGFGDAGSSAVTVTVSDNGVPAMNGTETFTLSVGDVNRPPVLDAIGNQSVEEETQLSFTASASDPDAGDTLSFTLDAAAIALGMSIDATTGAFSWTPSEAQGPGVYDVTVTVTDDGTPVLDDSETLSITVNEVNVAPVLAAIADQSVDEGASLNVALSASDADLPANTLSLAAQGLPAFCSLSDNGDGTGGIECTPGFGDAGSSAVTVTVSDDGVPAMNGTETFTLSVGDVNRPPVLDAIGNQSVEEETQLSFTASASDPDAGDTLSFTLDAAAIALGMSIDATTGAFSWTPSEAQGPGVYDVTVTVTDDGTPVLDDTETLSITVNEVNVAPVLGAIDNQPVDEGASLNVALSASDADLPANTLSLAAEGLPAFCSLSDNGDGTGGIECTPGFGDAGSSAVTVTVSDDGVPAMNGTETFTLSVGDVNRPPVLAPIGNQSVDEETVLSFTASASDPDAGDTLSFTLDAAAIALGMSIDATTGAFSWTPSEVQGPGDYDVTVTVTDDGTPVLDDTETLSITVNEVNVAPVLAAIADQSVDEGASLNVALSASDADLPANTLSLAAQGLPAFCSLSDNGDGTGGIECTPGFGDAGSSAVTVTVSDDGVPAMNDTKTFTLSVGDVNRPPVLAPIGNQSVGEETPLSFTASASDEDAGDTLSFSLDAAAIALGMSIDATTGAFSWTPSEVQGPGDYDVTVTVTDDGTPVLDDTETLSITVNEVNVAPVLAAIADQSVDEGASLNVALSASDADLPANTLSLAAQGLPAFCSLSDNGDGTGGIECTPGFGDAGSSAVTVTVSDDGVPAMNDTKTFTLSVGDVNRPPVLAPIGNQSVGEETPLSFTASASDEDAGDTLSFSLDAAAIALGMSIDATTGAFSWTPSEVQGPGDYDVTVTVTDDGTPVLDDTETLSITVNEVNVAPVLAAIADQSVDEGASLNVALSASDADLPANTLSLAAQGLPAFCSLSDNGDGTGGIECTPGFGDAGSSAVTVTVSDDGVPAMNDTKTFTLSVGDVNRPPVLAPIGNQSVGEETPLSFTASASDEDAGDTLSFSLDAAAIALGMSIDATTGAFSWTPSEVQGPGDYDVTVTVTDNGTPVLDDTETLSITVNEVNVAPVLAAIADQSVDEGASLNVALSASDADLPANTLSLAAQGLPAFCSLSDSGDGTGSIDCTPGFGDAGSSAVTVTVSDDGVPALSDTKTFTLSVGTKNQPPEFIEPIPANLSVIEGELLEFTIEAVDADGDPVHFDAANLPAGSSFEDNGDNTATFSWTPDFDQMGAVTPALMIIAFDDQEPPGRADLVVSITVGNSNRSPQFEPPDDETFSVDEGKLLEFVLTAKDPDGDPVSFDTVGIPDGAELIDNGDGTASFSWTPGFDQAGVHDWSVIALDDVDPPAEAEKHIRITVGAVNQPPILDPIGNRSAEVGELLTFLVTASDPDGDDNDLFFEAAGLPVGAELRNNDNGTATFSWTPGAEQTGNTGPIEIFVVDLGVPMEEEDSETIVITVRAERLKGDVDDDSDVDRDDVKLVLRARRQLASGPDDPRDLDGDGVITVRDAIKTILRCTRFWCATENDRRWPRRRRY